VHLLERVRPSVTDTDALEVNLLALAGLRSAQAGAEGEQGAVVLHNVLHPAGATLSVLY
jgi:hypothetical protein